MQRSAVVTGSSGLLGSEAVAALDRQGWIVHGIDNNSRREFVGPDGDTSWNLRRLRSVTRHFTHHELDIRDRPAILELFAEARPALIIHCAGQPSHDVAATRPFDDFDTNTVGTMNLLEATRRYAAESPFIFMSTNKVYGTAPNEIALVELDSRWEYANPADAHGIDESCRVDRTLHSLMGASKAAADLLVQEYGQYFGLPTVCFRAGCITGPHHAGAELHGFLAYLARAIRTGRAYRIFGYKGKQVRDNIHPQDVVSACLAFYRAPRIGAVFNLGGGRDNSLSVLEAIDRLTQLTGRPLTTEYVERPRRGDHMCYISDIRRWRTAYPDWQLSWSLADILEALVDAPPAEST